MKFKYYIAGVFGGYVKGTNDDEAARDLADEPDVFVINTESGGWLMEDGNEVEIEDIGKPA